MDQEAVERFARVVDAYRGPMFGPPPTPREMEIAFLTVVEGLSEPETAKRLVLSVKTIEGHRRLFVAKCGFTPGRQLWRQVSRAYWRSEGRDDIRGAG